MFALLAGAVIASAIALTAPTLAQAESIEVSHGANPTQDIALSISASGVADGKHKLYVYVRESAYYTCESTPGANYGGTDLANGVAVSAGAFSGEYSYTPTQTNTYTVCVYVDDSSYYSGPVNVRRGW